jgi:hypothetical protein
LLALFADSAKGEMAKGVYRSGVSQQLRQPEQDPQHRVDSTSTDPGEEKEDNLQCEAEEHKDLDGPVIPEIQWPCSHSFSLQ